MKYNILIFTLLLFFVGCSKELHVEDKNYNEALKVFVDSCEVKKTKDIYTNLCDKAKKVKNPKSFFKNNFKLQKVNPNTDGLLTGYYEASLNGSKVESDPYLYPIYETPNDLIIVDLDDQYKSLKGMRLRGRLDSNLLVPYYERSEIQTRDLDAKIICYTDSKIDLFFLEVQGSGRVHLDNGKSLHVGYANQNGHKYKSIGKYLIFLGEIKKEDISLQSIREWFKKNPSRVDEILNYNKSVVFFQENNHASKGSLGVVLTPNRSIAVDTKYVKLGSMLYLKAKTDKKEISTIVMAQDTGGAIKGKVRADMFLGYGEQAMLEAGELKADLELWMMLPKDKN